MANSTNLKKKTLIKIKEVNEISQQKMKFSVPMKNQKKKNKKHEEIANTYLNTWRDKCICGKFNLIQFCVGIFLFIRNKTNKQKNKKQKKEKRKSQTKPAKIENFLRLGFRHNGEQIVPNFFFSIFSHSKKYRLV